jgi:hypothetical protein
MIAPPATSMVTLLFFEVSTQPGIDIIVVHQCTDLACSQPQELAQLSGSYLEPQIVTSYTGYMRVRFTSDESINYDGFNALWSMVRLDMCFHSFLYCCNDCLAKIKVMGMLIAVHKAAVQKSILQQKQSVPIVRW